jgi:colanic acid biosynthesis glycosyl transferase WcaI
LRILIYGLNFWPELTGIGKYTGEMAAWLAARGHEVRVVTAPPYYPEWKVGSGYSAARYFREDWQGVSVFRAPLWVPFRPGGTTRVLHLASFALSSLPLLLRQVFWRPQVVWVVAPAFFCAPMTWLAARLCGARCWLHIQDFELDAGFGLGLMRGAAPRWVAIGLERWMLRRFDRVSSISIRMLERLRAKGVSADRVVSFPNWVDVAAIRPDNRAVATYRIELGIARETIVALYSGNMGKKQGLEILAQAASLTRSREDLIWVFCGDGAGRGDFEQLCTGLPNVRWLPLQPLERLGELLTMADIHLLPQRADVADLVMPSKLTGIMASNRPVVATARAGTEVASVVAGCGVLVECDDAAAFSAAVLALADDMPRRITLGRAARTYAEANLGLDGVLGAFEAKLLRLVDGTHGD